MDSRHACCAIRRNVAQGAEGSQPRGMVSSAQKSSAVGACLEAHTLNGNTAPFQGAGETRSGGKRGVVV